MTSNPDLLARVRATATIAEIAYANRVRLQTLRAIANDLEPWQPGECSWRYPLAGMAVAIGQPLLLRDQYPTTLAATVLNRSTWTIGRLLRRGILDGSVERRRMIIVRSSLEQEVARRACPKRIVEKRTPRKREWREIERPLWFL